MNGGASISFILRSRSVIEFVVWQNINQILPVKIFCLQVILRNCLFECHFNKYELHFVKSEIPNFKYSKNVHLVK